MNGVIGPQAWGQANAGEYESDDWHSTFPLCRLHNVRIVDELPRGCPLAEENPSRAIQELQDRAWSKMLDIVHDPSGGHDLERVHICGRCELHRNSRVRYLRAAMAETNQVMAASDVRQPDPSGPVGITVKRLPRRGGVR